MSTETTIKPADAAATLRVNEQKWSKPLMDAGWTAMPSIIIEKQKAFGLDAIDMNIIMHLASYWWTPDNKPHPSKNTIAEAMGIDPRTVQRRIKALDELGLIKRQERRIKGKGSKTNLYHFDGLIKEALPFANAKIKERAEADAARKAAGASRSRPKLQLVKDDE